MTLLQDVLHLPQAAALFAAYSIPRDLLCLVTWAVDCDLLEGVRLLIQHSEADFLTKRDDAASQLLHCAAANGCCVATLRLLACGGDLKRYLTMDAPLPLVDTLQLSFSTPPLPASGLYECVRRGDLVAVQWLHALTSYEPHEAMALAASRGHRLDIARWIGERALHKTRDPLHPYETDLHFLFAFDEGARANVAALTWTVQYVNASNQRVNRKFLATRAHGLAPVQKVYGWASERAFSGAMDFAAGHGDLALLWAMHDEQAEGAYAWSCTSAAMDSAAANGHLHVVQWLAESRTEACTQAAMDSAARNGHVAVMHWLARHQPLVPETSTFLAALEGGYVESLEWLDLKVRDDHLPSDALAVEAACESTNRLRVLQWLDQRKRIRVVTKKAMSTVISHGDQDAAKWLVAGASGGKHVELWNRVVSRWLSYEFALMHDDTFTNAALHGHCDMVQWLARAGPFYKIHADTLWKCASRGHLAVVAFLLEHPVHHPEDLECVPKTWTSFHESIALGNGGEEGGGGGVRPSLTLRREWQRLASEPPWAKQYVSLWLKHRPEVCQRVMWLAPWAKYCGHGELYNQLTTAPGSE